MRFFEQLFRSGEGDVMIAFSFPGTRGHHQRSPFARSRGAEIIAITDQKQSPVAQMSSAALLAPSEMLSFIDSMTAPMSLINALLVGIATKMGTGCDGDLYHAGTAVGSVRCIRRCGR